MAATVNYSQNVIQITAIDADWDWTHQFPTRKSIAVEWIVFVPGADGDKISIKDGNDTGPTLFPLAAAWIGASGENPEAQIMYYNGLKIRPVIDYDQSTLSAGHQVVILLAQDAS